MVLFVCWMCTFVVADRLALNSECRTSQLHRQRFSILWLSCRQHIFEYDLQWRFGSSSLNSHYHSILAPGQVSSTMWTRLDHCFTSEYSSLPVKLRYESKRSEFSVKSSHICNERILKWKQAATVKYSLLCSDTCLEEKEKYAADKKWSWSELMSVRRRDRSQYRRMMGAGIVSTLRSAWVP